MSTKLCEYILTLARIIFKIFYLPLYPAIYFVSTFSRIFSDTIAIAIAVTPVGEKVSEQRFQKGESYRVLRACWKSFDIKPSTFKDFWEISQTWSWLPVWTQWREISPHNCASLPLPDLHTCTTAPEKDSGKEKGWTEKRTIHVWWQKWKCIKFPLKRILKTASCLREILGSDNMAKG